MNADPASDEAPPGAFALAAVEKAWIPDEWYSQRSAIFKPNGEFVFRHCDLHRAGNRKITR
jgi:hypothetical protein